MSKKLKRPDHMSAAMPHALSHLAVARHDRDSLGTGCSANSLDDPLVRRRGKLGMD